MASLGGDFAVGQDEEREGTIIDARGIAGGHGAILLNAGLIGQRLHRRSALEVLIGIEHDFALAGLLHDRHDLRLETTSSIAMAARRWDSTANASCSSRVKPCFGEVFGGDTHVPDTERVGEHCNHAVEGLWYRPFARRNAAPPACRHP